jgi:hypothetical protein
MQLASDVNNPEFQGAIPNPDSMLFKEFYWYTPIDKWASEEASAKAQRRVIVHKKKLKFSPDGKVEQTTEDDKQIWIRIMKPGDQTSIIERQMNEGDKQRFTQEWLYWQMAEGLLDEGKNIPGWRLEEWLHLDSQPDMLRDLKHMRFYTVEQIAGASDAQIQRIGIGGPGLREQARVDLRTKLARDLNAGMEERDRVIADQAKALAELQAQMKALLNQKPVDPPPAQPIPASEKFLHEPKAAADLKAAMEIAVAEPNERDALIAQYQAKFGKKPHHKLGVDKIKAALAA